jgi:hypothetical protein
MKRIGAFQHFGAFQLILIMAIHTRLCKGFRILGQMAVFTGVYLVFIFGMMVTVFTGKPVASIAGMGLVIKKDFTRSRRKYQPYRLIGDLLLEKSIGHNTHK